MFNENQIHEIEAHGLTVAQVEAQIEAFKRGFPSLEVVNAAVHGVARSQTRLSD